MSILHQSGTTVLDGASYTYDNAGNRTAKTNKLNNVAEQYVYDAIYQLKQMAQGSTTTESYSYHPVGNRLSSLNVSSYSYNSSNELTSAANLVFTYDNNGNTLTKTTSGASSQYTWDFENRLSSAILPGSGGTVTFRYDPFGRRIQKSSASGTTDYLYDRANTIGDINSAGALVARYTQTQDIDEPLAQIRSGASSYYEQDGLGSVTSLSNSIGLVFNSYIYDTFGNLIISTGSLSNPFQYTGREFDTETGLRYYRARYYDPGIGRFINEDPLGFQANVNFYRYVGNNPIIFRDPTGKQQVGTGTATLPWTLPTGGGLAGATEAVTICFASGACETVITIGGVVVGSAGILYILYQAKPVYPYEKDWKKQPQFRCGKLNLPNRKPLNRCEQEWEDARVLCAALLAQPNPPRGLTGGYRDIESCARGFVSEACGGNPIDWGKQGPPK